MSILPPKRAVLTIRLTEADREVLVTRAIQANVPLSFMVRKAIREFVNKSQPVDPRVAKQAGPFKFLSSSDGSGGA